MHRIAIAALALAAGTARAQLGQINPPLGPVADTGPDLFQIEPRTPLSLENTPGDDNSIFRIEQPGHYYLTGDLVLGEAAVGYAGIEIGADDVVIDLNGFRIVGGGFGNSGVAGLGSRVSVKNGGITGFAGSGIAFLGTDHVVEDVSVFEIGAKGVSVGARSRVERVTVTSSGDNGIQVGSSGRVIDSAVAGSGANGIYLGSYASAIDSSASNSVLDGFYLIEGAAATRCTARNNQQDGFSGVERTTIDGCRSTGNNRFGYFNGEGGTVKNSAALDNADDGIRGSFASRILNNVCDDNGSAGIEVRRDSVVRGNVCDGNTVYGVHANGSGIVVDGNTASNSGTGFVSYGNNVYNNTLVNNIASGNSNYAYYVESNPNYFQIAADPATAKPGDNIEH